MHLGILGQAVGLFAVTNLDDLLLLSVLFAQGAGHRGSTRRIVLGQYLGFAAILAASLSGTFLPAAVIAYLGLLPLALGLRAARQTWRNHRDGADETDGAGKKAGPSLLEVVLLTVANGGDNLGAYVPVFATAGLGAVSAYAVVFLVLLAVWCYAGRFLATRPAVAKAFGRWGDLLLPVVLIAIGLFLLIEGGAFGL
ncbi:cadmium transporter [Streptomyces sp. NWU339]|uniref:cadmium resistance transporter n=1 Tax=Streptomyces sp. NWU339 TaxID=2185284 RepID=UPI000D67ED18|nr:cadmium resistance transporter [Streptomyces sp. NWU339]PWI09806.1 cadmium transporter [Streptomyces sp. NWU339]